MNADSHGGVERMTAILRSSRARRLVGMCACAVVASITAGPSLRSDRVRAQGERPRGRQIIGMHRPPKGSDDKRPYIWNDPSVLREGTAYSMWASKGLGPKGVAIYKLSSPDGETWQVENGGRPVLESGEERDFDSIGVETPMVIKVGNTYHMYYSAYSYGRVPLVTMGHAVSADGVRWKKLGELTSLTQPVGRAEGTPWGHLGRGEPAVVHHRGLFHLYFTDVRCRQDDCGGSPVAIRGISLATSRNGHDFEQRGTGPILLQTLSYPPTDAWEGYSTPWVFVYEGRFELFCDVFRTIGRQSIQTSITHLRSEDGVKFSEVAANVLTAGADDWSAVSVRSPAVLVTNTVWRMWYAGDNYDPALARARGTRLDAGVGLMTLPGR